MQKINIKIFDKKSFNNLKTNELTILLYIARFQDVYGHLRNLNYRFVTEETGMSKQTFYSSLRSLEEKGFINVIFNERQWGYFNVSILDNDFSDVLYKQDYSDKPYLSTNTYSFLYTSDFIKLSASNKRLILFIIRRLGGRKKIRLRMETLKTFAGVRSDRSIYKFLKNVRKWFDVFKVKGKATYIISLCDRTFKIKDSMTEAENEVSYQLKVKCQKNKIGYTFNELLQTARLYTHNKFYEKYGQTFENIVNLIIDRKGRLEYKLINWTLQYTLKKNGIKKKIADIPETEREFIDKIEEWLADNEDHFVPFSLA